MHAETAVPRVALDALMPDVIHEMSSKRLGMTTVVDGKGRLLGVISDGDLRRLVERDPDEVRNLAQRCAQAAKDTAAMIEESIAKSNDGKVKGAKKIELENGEAKARGIVTYPGGDRVDWKVIELPANATGQLKLLSYIPERSKQQGRFLPLASMSQAVLIRFTRVSGRLGEVIQ